MSLDRCSSRIAHEAGAVLRCEDIPGHAGNHVTVREQWSDDDERAIDPTSTELHPILEAHLARTAALRARGCTCTPGRLMDDRGPIYAEDATCPVHGTPLPEEPHHRVARQLTDGEQAAVDAMKAGLPKLAEKARALSERHGGGHAA